MKPRWHLRRHREPRTADGAGNPVESLGVHEHWNNSVERLYSRDRGESEGIELVRILR